jgi:hypothetical protein
MTDGSGDDDDDVDRMMTGCGRRITDGGPGSAVRSRR